MGGAGFLGIWTAMMSAMMLPSTVPLRRLDHAAARSLSRSVSIASGYLAMWIGFGCAVLGVDVLVDDRLRYEEPGREFFGDELVVHDDPLSWELTEHCAFASRFAYASE